MGFIALLYSVIVYVAFFASFLYLVIFVGGSMVPITELPWLGTLKTIDSGDPAGSWGVATNIGWLLLFAVPHTVMARSSFKKKWTKIVPWAFERSTYVLQTTVFLVLMYVYWQPMPDVVWSVDGGMATFLTVLFFAGIGLVLLSTFLINHFELFGLLQGLYSFQGKDIPPPKFVQPFLYKHVRHPLYLGWITFFWATPTMTTGHLLLAGIWSMYIFIAVGYEERDMVRMFGDKYLDYMAKVPAILPIGRKKD